MTVTVRNMLASDNFKVNLGGLNLTICQESDHQEALDLRYHHFLQDEPTHRSTGGHPVRTEVAENFGKNGLSAGTTIVARDPENKNEMVGIFICIVAERKDYEVPAPPHKPLSEYRKTLGEKYSKIIWIEEKYGRPSLLFEKFPDANRICQLLVLAVKPEYRRKGVGGNLCRAALEAAKSVWECDSAFAMCTSPYSKKICEAMGLNTYFTLNWSECYEEPGKLLYPNIDVPSAAYMFKMLK